MRRAILAGVAAVLLAVAVVLAVVGTTASGGGRPVPVQVVDGERFGSADTLERLAG